MAPTFSQRMGYVPPKSIQFESIDPALKNLLWHECYEWMSLVNEHSQMKYNTEAIQRAVWVEFFRLSLDSFKPAMVRHYNSTLAKTNSHGVTFLVEYMKQFFYNDKTPWHRLFDLIEFVLKLPVEKDYERDKAIAKINNRLTEEKSAYRLVNGQFVPITNEAELTAVRKATTPASTALEPVAVHVQQALNLLADRTAPDYRNSIKESISAVESLCKFISGMPAATLGPALEKTAKELDLNDHVRDGMKSIYKYTSDAHGIRHGLKDHEHPGQADAMFMLVNCSAFVNWVTEKARQQGKLPR